MGVAALRPLSLEFVVGSVVLEPDEVGALQLPEDLDLPLAPQVLEDYHERLKKRVEKLTASARLTLDAQDLAREVALFAERSDIAEELSRLGSHLTQFRAALNGEEQPGRKLDFIAQEMLREANTIGAKANDAAIAQAVVETKTAIDRIKEQVQNLE